MELIDIIHKSDISLIEGESKLGKLTFALYAYSQNEKIEKVTVISAIPKKLMLKRISSIKNLNDENLNKILENIEVLGLKENWLDIKSSYGFDFIYDDIERIIKETNCDAVIFHRPDLMFSEGEFEIGKLFLEKLIEIVNTMNGKPIFITAESEHFLTEFLENYTDISLSMQKENIYRKLIIKHSLYPINFDTYDFIYKNGFKIQVHQKETQQKTDVKTNKSKNVLIITKDEKFKKLNQYILDNNFEITFASNISMSDVTDKLTNQPDIVIYQDTHNNSEFNICSFIKQTSPNSEIIFISNKEYIRTEDKTDAMQSKCYEIFPKNFHLEEYILSIEKINNNFFYSNKIKFLPPQKISATYENFCKSIATLFNEKIFFSIIKTEHFDKNIISKLRNHDIIYIDEQNNFLFLCLINVTKEMFDSYLKEKLQLKDYHLIEVIEWDGKC